MRRDLRLDFFEPGDKARVADELGNYRVIRMPSMQRVGNNDLRLEPSYHDRDFSPRLRRVLNAAVRQPQVLAHSDTHHLGCLAGLLRAKLRRSTTGKLSRGEIENPGGSAEHVRADERAAAQQLDVVGMRGDRENVDLLHARKLPAPTDRGYFGGNVATRTAMQRSDPASLRAVPEGFRR